MVKLILILLLSVLTMQAKSSVGACIPIGKVVILKKSIMSLDLSKEQKEKLLQYEEKLKDELNTIKDNAKHKDERLSSLFNEKSFLKKKFFKITKKENLAVSEAISDYFEKMYTSLTDKQKVKLIKKFKRIERKKKKK